MAITAGQLIKMPLSASSGVTVLDAAVIVFCLPGILKLKFKLKKPPLFVTGALLFLVTASLSLILTPLHLQLSQYFLSFLYTIRFSAYILLGWEIYSGAYPDLSSKIPGIFIYSGLALAVLGLAQFIFFPDLRFLAQTGWDPHYFRTVSTFFDPNFAGAFFILALILLVSLKNRFTTLFFAILYFALLTTFSRSSYLMFLISGLEFSIVRKSKKYFLTTLILFTLLLTGFWIYNRLVATPRNISRSQSASFRLSTWQQGLQIFEKNPLLGVGFNAYKYAVSEYKLGDTEFLKSHGSSSNDSSLLFVVSTTGILGLAAYLFFLFSMLSGSNKRILLPAVLGLIAHSIFNNSLFYPPILGWLILMSAAPKK